MGPVRGGPRLGLVLGHLGMDDVQCLDVAVAHESSAHLRANDLELTVQVVGRLQVGVGDLPEQALVVIDHLGAVEVRAAQGHVTLDVQGLHELRGDADALVVGVQVGRDAHLALIEAILDAVDGLAGLGRAGGHGDMHVGEDSDAELEVVVLP